MSSSPLRTLALAHLAVVVVACVAPDTPLPGSLSGEVRIDGSSTVQPISEAVAEEFQRKHPNVRVTVGISGTGGGFQRFCEGEVDINDASRRVTQEERDRCAETGVEFVELPIAWDGITIVAHPSADFVECLSVQQLRRIWAPGSQISRWNEVDARLPAREITLFGAGTNSGTFDYFTEKVMGRRGASRSDYQASEDDYRLVAGIAGDESGLGYFGYAYYLRNRDRLHLIAVDGGAGCVYPDRETIRTGSYAPLTRLLYIYVSKASMEREVVAEYVRFLLDQAPTLVPATGYHELDPAAYEAAIAEVEGAVGG